MQDHGLVASYLLDGRGGGRPYDREQIAQWTPVKGVLWVHLNLDSDESHQWLHQASGLDPLVTEALMAESTRPRCAQMGGGVLLFLRGVNLNPGADPEDMVSIRVWLQADRIISVRLRRLMSIEDLRSSIDQGHGPTATGDFVAHLADRLATRMAGVIGDVDDEIDRLQDRVLENESRQLRTALNQLRRGIIALRRYLAPQRDALARLTYLKIDWIGERALLQICEEADRMTRYVEDLDAARERAGVTQEELTNRLSEQLNARMY